MQASMFSPIWHRYATLKPRLKSHVNLLAQQYRDQQWYILTGAHGEQVRLNLASYAFIGRCDGRFTVQQIWQAVLQTQTEEAPTQDEVIQLLNDLDQHDLLVYDVLPNIGNLFKRKKQKQSDKTKSLINPFAFRIPVFNPSHFLTYFNGLLNPIFNSVSLIIWLAIIMLGIMVCMTHWAQLVKHALTFMPTQRYLLIAFLSYPFIKAIHELSHALAIKKWGGDVKEAGITLFMLTPAPYVDASAMLSFKPKAQRIIVSLIGMMTELFIAAVALMIFVNAQPSITKDIAFVVAFICGVSSLLFNGNPLLRFDAYYAMCDLLALPNLASRSRAYWSNLLSRYLNGADANIKPMQLAKGEKKWLMMYSPLSLLYTLGIFTTFVFLLGAHSVLLGLTLAAILLISLIFKPLFKFIHQTLKESTLTKTAFKVKFTLVAIAALLGGLIFFVPIPNTTIAQGVVWVPDNARIRTESDGVLQRVFVKDNDMVSKGQLIAILDNPELLQEQRNLESQIQKLNIDQFNAMFNNPEESNNIAEKINKLKVTIARNQEKIEHLKIVSQANGRFVMPHQQDVLNSYLKQGQDLAYVLNKDNVNLRVALPAESVDMVQNQLVNVNVKLAEFKQHTYDADLILITPSSTNQLPSKALGDQGGGTLITNIEDKTGLQTKVPVVWVDLTLPEASLDRVGGRAYVRFNHVSTPIAVQIFRHLKQIFLSQFNPST